MDYRSSSGYESNDVTKKIRNLLTNVISNDEQDIFITSANSYNFNIGVIL